MLTYQESSCNPSMMFYAAGNSYLENGKFDVALELLNKSLKVNFGFNYFTDLIHLLTYFKSVSYENEILIDLLGSASMCYMSKWMIKEAETLAILGLKIARYF